MTIKTAILLSVSHTLKNVSILKTYHFLKKLILEIKYGLPQVSEINEGYIPNL